MDFSATATVAIIGAGPYGLSVAAHLKAYSTDFRIFGEPMHRWQCQMPSGMFLKSEGCASSLSDHEGRYSLASYCAEKGLPYGNRGVPVSRETFTEYALSFQRNVVPTVEEVMVTSVAQSKESFEVRLADGAALRTAKVIVATGLEHTAHIPDALANLPRGLQSHSGNHHNLNCFKGRDVTVIGGGQSALETAALLAEEGASVRLLVRKPSLVWNAIPEPAHRSLYQRLRYPISQLGSGLELWTYCAAPMLFRHLPGHIRMQRVKNVLGPAGAWWLKDRIEGRLQVLTGVHVQKAVEKGSRAVLKLARQDGGVIDVTTEHVIAATGYRFDLKLLPFLSDDLKLRLRTDQQQPALSSHFESSVPGLYFTGLASTNSFGPAMRFLHGADYTALRISRHIAGQRRSASPPAGASSGNSKCA